MEQVEDCISFLVGKAAQQVTRRARERLAAHGVTPTQYAVLKVLWQEDGRSGAELSERLVIDSATVTGVIDRLESAELLERRSDAADRRIQRLYLTATGRSLRQPLDAAMDQLNADARAVIGDRTDPVWQGLKRLGNATHW